MSKPIPAYQRVRDQLKRQILDPSSKLEKLSESQIIAQYQVGVTTARRVLNELAELGLVERRSGAGSLVRRPNQKRVKELGIIFYHVGDPDAPYFSQLIDGIEARARDQEHTLHLCAVRSRSIADSPEGALGHLITRRKLDGLFILSPLPARDIRFLHEQQIPLLVITNTYPEIDVPTLTLDYARAARNAAESLRRAGCGRLALLTGPAGRDGVHRAHEQWVKGFQAFHKNHGMRYDPAHVQPLTYAAEHVDRVMTALAETPAERRPDGIIAATAIASEAAHRFLATSQDWRPHLIRFTHDKPQQSGEVKLPYHELGKRAFDLLDQAMNMRQPPTGIEYLPVPTVNSAYAPTPSAHL